MRKLLSIIFLGLSSIGFAQSEIGTRFQIYPAGYITTAQFVLGTGEKSAWIFELGYNTANRKDFGEHDNEEGGGFGLGAGYRRYFKEGMKGFYVEANLETWFLEIDWSEPFDSSVLDIICDPGPCVFLPDTGITNITVLQPTLGIGYQFRFRSEKWGATIGATFGREWNVKTKGEEVGQGGISLLNFSVTRRL